MFGAGDIRRNVLLKFVRLCTETPCLCPSEGRQCDGRKLTKTYVIELAIKSPCSRLLRTHKHLYEYLFSYKDGSDCEISGDKSPFLT